MSNPLYTIRDWDRNFENSESRKIKNLGWVPFQNKHDSAPFRRVAALKNSSEIFTAWVLIVQVASKMPVRGILQNSSGPLTSEDLSLMTGFPEKIFKLAFDELQKPGIQWILADTPTRRENLPEHPDTPGSFGPEQNRTEQKGTEDFCLESESLSFKQIFETARKFYPGTKLGLDTEWSNFTKRNKPEIAEKLLPAIEAEKEHKNKSSEAGLFVPQWKNFKTWINANAWDQEFGEISKQKMFNQKTQRKALPIL